MGISQCEMKSAVYSLLLHYGYGSCPCRKIGEDFGEVRMGNEHLAQDDLTQFHAHVDTPIGNEQREDYAFLLRFSEPVTAFMQFFGEVNADNSDSFVDDVIITPLHRISGDPYTFNVNGLVENGNVEMDAWYCESSEDIENVAAACFSDGQSAQDQESNEGSGDETDEPQWECDTYTRCVVKFNTAMTIGNARAACDAHNGALPFPPKNDEENLELAMIGSTWLNFWVNDKIDMKYDNFERRQRAYLNAEEGGVWEIRHGTETADFFCVEKKPMDVQIFSIQQSGEPICSIRAQEFGGKNRIVLSGSLTKTLRRNSPSVINFPSALCSSTNVTKNSPITSRGVEPRKW